MDLNNAEPQSFQEEALGHNLKQEVAAALGRNPQGIEFGNLSRYLNGSRFLKGFTAQTDERPAGFFKMSTGPEIQKDTEIVRESEERIAREWNGTKLAREIGIPSVNILTDYRETAGKKRILELEQIDPDSGAFIPAELVKNADPIYGEKAAAALMVASGKEIPSDVSAEGVNNGDWRNKSLESFLIVWHESDRVFDPQYADIVSQVVRSDKLKEIANTALSELQEEIPQHATPDRRFFVHNDAAPNNMFFQDTSADRQEQTLLLDYEQSGYSTNKFAAQLTDLGGFYGRAWANKDMQQAFIKGIMDASTEDSPEYKYKLAKSSIVFGTLFLAKYAMEPTHPEYQMTRNLLGNLEENLAFLDKIYKSHQTDSNV